MSAACRCRKMYCLKHTSILQVSAEKVISCSLTFTFRKGLSIITLLSNRLYEGHVYKLIYDLVLYSRPIQLDMNTWAHAIQNDFL